MEKFVRVLLVGMFALLLEGQGCITIDCNFASCAEGCMGCDCSSCGCSCNDCAACEECGLGPIPGGYNSVTVANAAQVRLTGAGLTFIEANVQGIVESLAGVAGIDASNGLVAPVPPIDISETACVTILGDSCSCGSFGCISITVAANACDLVEYPMGSGTMVESCYIKATIEQFELNPIDGTNMLEVRVGVALDTLDQTGASGPITVDITSPINDTCDVTLNSAGFDYRVEVGFEPIPAGRIFEGYSQLVIGAHDFVGGEAVGGLQASQFSTDCPYDNIVDYPGTIAQSGNQTINGGGGEPGLIDMLSQFLCYQVPDPDYCPTGSTPNDLGMGTAFTCVEDAGPNAGSCVPLVLGSENRIDFGKLMAGISPSTNGVIDMVMAIAGDGIADATGYSLDMLSGAAPLVPNDCVPWEEVLSVPPVVPQAANFHGDVHPDGTSTHHVAVGISEAYGNYFMDQLWRGGAFCLSVGTGLSDLLTTGLLSIIVTGLGDLAFPASSASLALNVLPNQPPLFEIGDPGAGEDLITVQMNDLDVDFYVWSNERYVRFMTLNSDFVLGLGVTIDAMGDIGIELGTLAMNNATVRNSENITADPAALGPAFANLLGSGLVDMFLPAGGIPAFSLPSTGNLTLDIDLTKATEGTDDFLGVFVTMGGTFTGFPLQKRADTTLEVATVNVPDATPFQVDTFGQGELPSVEVAMAGSGFDGAEYEFSYRLDGRDWSEWTRSRYAVVQGPSLLLQGRHTVEARARAVGERGSSDLSPASAEFVVDVSAPTVEVKTDADGTVILADDIVTPADRLTFRFRALDGDWSEWMNLGAHERTLSDARGPGGSVLVQVRDEVGNVGGATEELRGETTNATASSCGGGCSTSGENLPTTGLFALLFASMLFVRRRRQA